MRLRASPSVDRVGWWLLVALLVPRVIRLIYPYVWIEDDPLLESALAISRGLRPFVDFNLPQMPLLEWIAGAYIKVVGASTYSMEILNGAAIYATSVLIVLVGQRAVGRAAAVLGALLFACSSLVFRYHLWTREFFVTALVLGAALIILRDTMATRRQVLAVGALLWAACAIKLTAAVSVAGLLAFMAIAQRRAWRAVAVALMIGLGLGLLAAFCYWRYGFDFLYQEFIFHFLKGTVTGTAMIAASILDVLLPLFVLGVIALARARASNLGVWLVVSVLGPLALFYMFLSPTAWGHNYLDPLPWIAIVSGAGAAWLIRECRRLSVPGLVAVVLVAVSLLRWTPIRNLNWSKDSVYGFGFVPRRELTEVASALREATGLNEEVVAPSFIAFEANRIQLTRFPENYGVIRAGEQEYLTHGFSAARQQFGRRGFYDLIKDTSAYQADQFESAVRVGGPVNAVILDSPLQWLPLVTATNDALLTRGFRAALKTTHYTLWLRAH